ncbi:MAG TPA: hypothetical protein VFI35_14330 [Actinomycetota bacterium]|nr:hypothetical protein [Actinomycetota bacterium]
MRFAIRLLVPLTAVAVVACGAEPVPVAERFPTAAEAPGTKPDPDEKRQTTDDFDEFLVALIPALIDPDREEMTTVFPEADFTRAGVDFRFYGERHSHDAPHLISWFIELDSEDGANSALDWLEADAMKPCPGSCATRVSSFDVESIGDARGVHRIATAEGIEAAGTEEEVPNDSYWVGFTIGSIIYTVDLHGPPGSVSEEQVQTIASAFYERLTAS